MSKRKRDEIEGAVDCVVLKPSGKVSKAASTRAGLADTLGGAVKLLGKIHVLKYVHFD